MRAVLVAFALLVGFGSTDAFAKDAVLVRLRDREDAPKAKPSPTAKKSRTTTKRKPARKHVAKSKPKAKKKAPAAELRPMP
jgi:hypothetical protein